MQVADREKANRLVEVVGQASTLNMATYGRHAAQEGNGSVKGGGMGEDLVRHSLSLPGIVP